MKVKSVLYQDMSKPPGQRKKYQCCDICAKLVYAGKMKSHKKGVHGCKRCDNNNMTKGYSIEDAAGNKFEVQTLEM